MCGTCIPVIGELEIVTVNTKNFQLQQRRSFKRDSEDDKVKSSMKIYA